MTASSHRGRTDADAARGRWTPRLVWAIAAVGLGCVAMWAWTSYAPAPAPSPALVLYALSLVLSMVAFILSGALIASRRRAGLIGWLLMIPGLTVPLTGLASRWLAGLDPPPTEVTPALWLVLWSLSWDWVLLIFPIFHLLLTFPSGNLLSTRWRWAVVLEGLMLLALLVVAAVADELEVLVDDVTAWSVANPIGFVTPDLWDGAFGVLWEAGLLVLTLTSVAAVIVRFRRGSRDERQQLKWPLLAMVLFGIAYGLSASELGQGGGAIQGILFSAALAAIPISVAIAILRYRLYAIDRIISRTIGYALVTGLLAAAFVATVLVMQAVLASFTQGETVAVAASTLVVATLFQPVRSRVQAAVDRRFDRARVDGERTASAFAERLRDEVAIEALAAELRATIDLSIKPSTQGLWLRETSR